MSDAAIVTTAAALVTFLNDLARSYSQSFTAARVYDPERTVKELATLKVDVIPSTWQRQQETRGSTRKTFTIDIGVRVKVSDSALATVDPWLAFVEEVADSLPVNTTMGSAKLIGVENDPLFSPEHLREHRVFFSVLTCRFWLFS